MENDPPEAGIRVFKMPALHRWVIPLNKVPSNYTERFGGGLDVLIGLPIHFLGKSYKHLKKEKKTRTLQKNKNKNNS